MKDIGWLEVRLKIPDDWELTAESGGLNDAYMRFNSIEKIKMEVRWEHVKKKGEALPYTAIENFLKSVVKSSKEKAATKVTEKGNAKVAGHRAAYYIWSMKDARYVTMSWLCQDEGKLMLLQYGLEEAEAKEELFEEILKNISCHTDLDSYEYEVLGVSFKAPKGYHLTKRKIMLGKVYLFFTKEGSQLYVCWSGLAKEQLRNYKGLGNFFLSMEAGDVRTMGKGMSELLKKVKTNDMSIELESVSKGMIPVISKEKVNFLRVYLDESSNRIFTVAFSVLRNDEQMARSFAESIKAKL